MNRSNARREHLKKYLRCTTKNPSLHLSPQRCNDKTNIYSKGTKKDKLNCLPCGLIPCFATSLMVNVNVLIKHPMSIVHNTTPYNSCHPERNEVKSKGLLNKYAIGEFYNINLGDPSTPVGHSE